MKTRIVWGLLAGLGLIFSACGGISGEEAEELVDGALLPEFEGKEDSAGGRTVRVLGATRFGTTKIGRAGGSLGAIGYRLTARAGDALQARVVIENTGILYFYGPRRADGSWGSLVLKRWAYRSDHETVLEHTFSRAGTYLLVVGPTGARPPEADFFLSVCGRDGACPQRCARYDWTYEMPEGTLRRFIAFNLSGAVEAEWRISRMIDMGGMTGLSLRSVSDGACAASTTACGRTRSQVCGTLYGVRGDETYASICEFENAVLELAGEKWGSRTGDRRAGACE